MSLYDLTRTVLFKLDAERVHEWTLAAFKRLPQTAALFSPAPVDDPCTFMGLRFANRVGLAAGLDKNGECIRAWSRMGFGFTEVGTVTPRPQPGNPKPRMFRLPEHQAIINRLGFNNLGVDHLLEQVRETEFRGILGINIGKNFDTPIEQAADDYLHCLRKVHAHAGYITINISSPNTKGLRDLQDEKRLEELLRNLREARDQLAQKQGRKAPMLLKIAPDLSPDQIKSVAVTARQGGMDGVIATNTTIQRPGLQSHPLAAQQGGLSGAPVMAASTEVLRMLRRELGRDYPLIGVGGILAAEDAQAKFAAGADLLQLYTGFIYRGPALIHDCALVGKVQSR